MLADPTPVIVDRISDLLLNVQPTAGEFMKKRVFVYLLLVARPRAECTFIAPPIISLVSLE